MDHTAIIAEHIAKEYFISHRASYGTLRDSVSELIKKPFQRKSSRSSREEFWALRDVNFTIKAGERIGIIGKNGAGKSTLLKVLSQITPPTSGQITLHGRVASLLEVGTGFHPELTGRENIFLNGAVLGMKQSEIREKFQAIVDFAEVERFLDTPVKRYSSGMYVRLAFAVAAHLDPEILLVDEVLSVGDAEFQKKSLGKIEEVSQSGRTVIFVSHNLGAIAALCTKVMYLAGGKIQYFGDPDKAIQLYTADTAILSGAYDLTRSEVSRRGDGHARFTSIELTDKDAKPVSNAQEGRPFYIGLRLSVDTPLDLRILSITLVDHLGTDVLTAIHYDSLPLNRLAPGQYHFVAQFDPNLLARGHYTVRLACLGKNFYEYDHIHDAVSLIVAPPADEPDILVARPGLIRMPIPWTVENS